MPLSDTFLRNAKPAEKPWKKSDGGGLFILVSPKGKCVWRLAYRFAGKQQTLSLGEYPFVGLADARKAREAAKAHLANGVDPGEAPRREKHAVRVALKTSFEYIAREWHYAQRPRWTEGHAGRVIRRLERDIFPRLGERPIIGIEPPELLAVLQQVEKRGALDIAKRLREHCSQIFRFAIASGRAKRDPCADLKGALIAKPREQHFAAMPRAELPGFLRALDHYGGDLLTRLALKLIILTWVRTKELRLAEWCEFEGLDGDKPLWRIPAEKMKVKGRNDHLVPLPRQAVDILKQLYPITGHSPFLFPSGGKQDCMSENTMIYALYRMGYHTRATVHGFRRVASTTLNEEGFHPDWIERQLAHDEANKVRAAYNSAQYLPGRREMLQWYADHLDEVKEKRKPVTHGLESLRSSAR
jgi:integrase